MACTTSFLRSVARASLRSLPKPKSTPKSIPTASLRPPSLTRLPAELGCMSGSLLPLHSAVAAARLTSCLSTSSRSCRALSQGQVDFQNSSFGLILIANTGRLTEKHMKCSVLETIDMDFTDLPVGIQSYKWN